MILNDKDIGPITIDGEGEGEVEIQLDAGPLAIWLSLGSTPTELGLSEGSPIQMLPCPPAELWRRAHQALGDPAFVEAVDLYRSHHEEECGAEVVKGPWLCRGASVHGFGEAGSVTVDLGYDEDLTDYLLAVQFGPSGEVQGIEMES